MEYRFLGHSGFKVPALGFGAGTFGGKGPLFSSWGNTQAAQATNIVDLCLEHGINLFDTADVYSEGDSERILGTAIKGRREQVILSTKITLRVRDEPNDIGAARHRLISATEQALQRLNTDYIDILQLHHFDAMTPVESIMDTLNDLVRTGKVRYIGVSNYSGWHIMKHQAIADRYGYIRLVANQVYYSLVGRDYEWELMPVSHDQGLGAIVWSPLGWGRLTGKISRKKPAPKTSRLHGSEQFSPPVTNEQLYHVVDVLEEIANETNKSVPQISLNWLLQRPTISSVLIGARNEQQLLENIGSIGWHLTPEQIKRLDIASQPQIPYPYYPYWNGQFTERNPPLVANYS